MSRSPSGQWYPQQQQQMLPQQQQQMSHIPQPPYNAMTGHPQMPQQWSPTSGAATPMLSPGGPNAGNPVPNLGNSGTFNSSIANFWNPNPGAAGVGADAVRRSSLPGGMTPQQQMMMQQGMLPGQDQCCATCCGPQQQCCGPQQQCCGPTSGGCCGPSSGSCCPMPGEPVDPFCCTPPAPGQEPPCYVTVYNCFDWTFFFACVLFVLTVVGFAVVMATKSTDDIFKRFNARTTTELDAAMHPYIAWMNVNMSNSTDSGSSSSESSSTSLPEETTTTTVAASLAHNVAAAAAAFLLEQTNVLGDALNAASAAAAAGASTAVTNASTRYAISHNCTQRKLLGSFGAICMEDNMFANTFAVQLSSWTNARDTLWFLAMVYSTFALLYAILINVQRHPAAGTMGAGANALPPITPEEQDEFMKMTPQQQQAFMQEYQQRVGAVLQQDPNAGMPQAPGAGCCGADSGIEFYDTPYYEFVRIAWFVSGLTAFVWTCNLFISFWAFSNFYIEHTTGPLRLFWRDYARKMNASLVVVTIFLAWPFCNFFLELVVWLIGALPWLVIRSTCKRGIEMYRPALPLSQLPMYIRADMFFMDFQDVKRLGFSRQAWIMLTGSDRPFFDSCDDPTVDKDPAMTQLMQMRAQWQLTMMSMMPPWMQRAGGFPGMMMGPNGQMMGYPQQQQMMLMMNGGGNANHSPSQAGTPATIAGSGAVLPTSTPAEYPIEENEVKTHRRRRHSTHERHRHADPAGAEQSSMALASGAAGGGAAAGGAANSSRPRRRHRSKSRSRSKAAFESGAASPVPLGTDAAVAAAAAGGNTPGATTRHRRRHSRSKERGASGGASPVPAAAGAGGEEGGEGGHHRRRSRSRSKAAGDAAAAAAATGAAAAAAPDTQHRHRRRSHSRSREKPSNKAAAAADLDALLKL